MRHKYETRGIVLSRTPSGEANAFVTLLTPTLGLVRARAQSVRRSGAKLSAALVTFAESDLVLVRGREGWRVTGAVLAENWFGKMECAAPRRRAARVSGLLVRLVAGEAPEPELFPIIKGFFEALAALPEEAHESAEMLAALRSLAILGLDAGLIQGASSVFAPTLLASVETERADYIARINRGIIASGL
ncbi:MAG: recombination protein O N-terminal domain-containing protein [Candidatus Kaiserbacteria bacterium]|nr:recombination protein O N-terminal domain-containing protein [Candidatus Kaiserbacteria bacterium]